MKKKITNILFIVLLFSTLVLLFLTLKKGCAHNATPRLKDSIQKQIDTVVVNVVKYKDRVSVLKVVDTVEYIGSDTTCMEIIERKTRLINALDTLNFELDKEAQLYDEMAQGEIRRNAALLDSIGVVTELYKDSVLNQAKTIKKERRRTFFYKLTTTAAVAIGLYGIVK